LGDDAAATWGAVGSGITSLSLVPERLTSSSFELESEELNSSQWFSAAVEIQVYVKGITKESKNTELKRTENKNATKMSYLKILYIM
jgi:hypothetical protein